MDDSDVALLLGGLRHFAEEALGLFEKVLADGCAKMDVWLYVLGRDEGVHDYDDAVGAGGMSRMRQLSFVRCVTHDDGVLRLFSELQQAWGGLGGIEMF